MALRSLALSALRTPLVRQLWSLFGLATSVRKQSEQAAGRSSSAADERAVLVRCRHCGTHIPQARAHELEGSTFVCANCWQDV